MKKSEDYTPMSDEEKNDYRRIIAKCFQTLYPNAYRTQDEDKHFITVDGTPDTCHLFLLQDKFGFHVVMTNNNMEADKWRDYVVTANKVYLNTSDNEVSFEMLNNDLIDTSIHYNVI